MNEQPNILIIDDDRELGDMLVEYLSREGLTARVCSDGRDGMSTAVEGDFDAIVLDVMLPGINGFDVLRGIRASSQVPVIMLTARGEDTDRIVGLELGADDYLPKPFNPRELTARLRAILRRSRSQAEGTLEHHDVHLDRQARRVSVGDDVIDLTAAEFAILERLLERAGQVVSKDELAEHALGRSLAPFDRSIDTHVSRLRRKLGPSVSGSPRIQAVRGRGYLLIGPVE